MYRIAAFMGSPNIHMLGGYAERTPGILLIASVVAGQLASLDWTKEKIKEFLWENSIIPVPELKRTGFIRWMPRYGISNLDEALPDPWPITGKPENIIIVVAGERHPAHAY